jgi:hypothetical protein
MVDDAHRAQHAVAYIDVFVLAGRRRRTMASVSRFSESRILFIEVCKSTPCGARRRNVLPSSSKRRFTGMSGDQRGCLVLLMHGSDFVRFNRVEGRLRRRRRRRTMWMSRARHARAPDSGSNGRIRAVTVLDRDTRGLIVWAGILHESVAAKPDDQLEPGDYLFRECVSFACWEHVERYFRGRVYATLIDELRPMRY